MRDMDAFDYLAPAELFTRTARRSLTYRRFSTATEAIQHAIEVLSPSVLSQTTMEVEETRFEPVQIRALYDGPGYPGKRASAP